MAKVKARSGRSLGVPPGRQRHGTAMGTTALAVAVGALPKGVVGFTFKAPRIAARALAGKPAKVKPLLQGYGEAFARSREEGHSVSFRVDVDPDGDATITPVSEPTAKHEVVPVEEPVEASSELQRALAAARERGRIRASEVLVGEDMLSAEAFAKLLGTSRVTVNAKRQNGQVLGLDGAKRGFRFPVWQLDREGKPYADLPTLHEELGGPWAVYRFLVQPHGALDGLTGREALERGRAKAVLAAAESIGRGDFR